jgi:hypothetical protein
MPPTLADRRGMRSWRFCGLAMSWWDTQGWWLLTSHWRPTQCRITSAISKKHGVGRISAVSVARRARTSP